MSRRWRGRILAMLLGLAAGLLLTELLLRLLGLGDPVDGTDLVLNWEPADLFQPDVDPQIGVHLKAGYVGKQMYRSAVDGRVLFEASARVTAAGFRDEPTASEGRTLLAVGDSTTFGQGVPEGSSWPGALGAQLGNDWRVLNAGVPGRNLSQDVRWVQVHGMESRPNVTILSFYINDLLPPLPVSGDVSSTAMTAPPWAGREAGLRRVSRLYNLAWRGYERRRLAHSVAGEGFNYVEKLSRTARREDLDREFERFVRACREAGSRPVVLVLPVYDVADPRAAEKLLTMAASSAGAQGALVLLAADVLDDLDIPDRVVLPGELHASAMANGRVATFVHAQLEAAGVLR